MGVVTASSHLIKARAQAAAARVWLLHEQAERGTCPELRAALNALDDVKDWLACYEAVLEGADGRPSGLGWEDVS